MAETGLILGRFNREEEIPDTVPEPLAATFELGLGAPGILGILVFTRGVLKPGSVFHDFHHLLGIVLPVGRQVNKAIGSQFVSELFNKGRLHQATLVVLFLVPGGPGRKFARLPGSDPQYSFAELLRHRGNKYAGY